MIRHLFRLVWNRRRASGLILMELTLSFLVLCAVYTFVSDLVLKWGKPLGFDYPRVWHLALAMPHYEDLDEASQAEAWQAHEQLRLALGRLAPVEAFTPLDINVPFSNSLMAYRTYINGKPHAVRPCLVLPDAKEVLGLRLVAGRWLEPGDAHLEWTAVVVNRAYAEALYGREDPVGKTLVVYERNGEPDKHMRERRVVGVVSAYRARGEQYDEDFVEFSHFQAETPAGGPPGDWLLRIRPGVPAAFEQELLDACRAAAPSWYPTVTPLVEQRARALEENLAPLLVFALIAAFLLIMVGLGLTGVLWESVTRHTEELGLRRALGATAAQVQGQVLGELMVLTTVAVALGALLFVQAVPLGLFPGVALGPHLLALTLSAVVLYPFVVLCGLYPGWLATRVKPAEALQHE